MVMTFGYGGDIISTVWKLKTPVEISATFPVRNFRQAFKLLMI
jgi:hypothetical protein